MRFEKIRNLAKKKEPSSPWRIRGWLLREPMWVQFLARLLASLTGRPCFCMVIALAVGLTIGLAIGRVELMGREVAIVENYQTRLNWTSTSVCMISTLASPEDFCERSWSVFLGAKRLTIVPKYFLPWSSSLSTLPDSKSLVDGLTPTHCHRRCCLKLPPPRTLCYFCRRRLIPVLFCSPAPSWCCLTLAMTRETHCKLSTSLVVWACRLVCLLGVILKMVQRTWPLVSGFVWSWCIYYSTKLYYWEHSFLAWRLYCELASKALEHGGGSSDKRSSALLVCWIVLWPFLIGNEDWCLSQRKCKDDSRN